MNWRSCWNFMIGESIHLPFENPIYDFVKIGSIAPDIVDRRDGDEEEEELSLDEFSKRDRRKYRRSEK